MTFRPASFVCDRCLTEEPARLRVLAPMLWVSVLLEDGEVEHVCPSCSTDDEKVEYLRVELEVWGNEVDIHDGLDVVE